MSELSDSVPQLETTLCTLFDALKNNQGALDLEAILRKGGESCRRLLTGIEGITKIEMGDNGATVGIHLVGGNYIEIIDQKAAGTGSRVYLSVANITLEPSNLTPVTVRVFPARYMDRSFHSEISFENNLTSGYAIPDQGATMIELAQVALDLREYHSTISLRNAEAYAQFKPYIYQTSADESKDKFVVRAIADLRDPNTLTIDFSLIEFPKSGPNLREIEPRTVDGRESRIEIIRRFEIQDLHDIPAMVLANSEKFDPRRSSLVK